MPKYIDIEAIVDCVKKEIAIGDNISNLPALMGLKTFLDNLPGEDMAPVVRCKDCKYFNQIMKNYSICDKFSEAFFNMRKEDDYCSYGVRKEEKI